MNRRVVLDTSVLVSAALRVGSTPHQALMQAMATCDLCASQETLAKLDRVLDRDLFDRYVDRATRREFILLIRSHVHLFAISTGELAAVDPPCRDTNYNQFLALAQVAEADTLVSGDEDLLVLHPWHRIAIVTPAGCLTAVIA